MNAKNIMATIAVVLVLTFLSFVLGWVSRDKYGRSYPTMPLIQLKCVNNSGAVVFNHTGKIRSVVITDDDGNGTIVMSDLADGELLAPQDALCSLAAVPQNL